MPLRRLKSHTFFVTGLFCAALLFACNRHTTTSSVEYSFTGPVRGDTVNYYPTMNAQLRQDSIEQNEAYFYRINRVKRVEITDKNSVEINEIDRFGHLLMEEVTLSGSLFWRNIDVYNRYGHTAWDEHSFYNDGHVADLVSTSKYTYEPDGWTLGERIKSIEMTINDIDDRESDVYAYVYHYDGRLMDYETRFKNSKCTEKVFITYNEFDKPVKEVTINYEENIPDTSIEILKYDSLQRVISCAETKGEKLINDRFTEYNNAGRMSKYSSITYEPFSQWTFRYYYSANGLLEERIVEHGEEKDTEVYRYAFY